MIRAARSFAAVALRGATLMGWFLSVLTGGAAPTTALDYTLELRESFPAASGGGKWFQPRPVAIPTRDGSPLAVMTIQQAIGSDFFTDRKSVV